MVTKPQVQPLGGHQVHQAAIEFDRAHVRGQLLAFIAERMSNPQRGGYRCTILEAVASVRARAWQD